MEKIDYMAKATENLKRISYLQGKAVGRFYAAEDLRNTFLSSHRDLTAEEHAACMRYLAFYLVKTFQVAKKCEALESEAYDLQRLGFSEAEDLASYTDVLLMLSEDEIEKSEEIYKGLPKALKLLDTYIQEARESGEDLAQLVRSRYDERPAYERELDK